MSLECCLTGVCVLEVTESLELSSQAGVILVLRPGKTMPLPLLDCGHGYPQKHAHDSLPHPRAWSRICELPAGPWCWLGGARLARGGDADKPIWLHQLYVLNTALRDQPGCHGDRDTPGQLECALAQHLPRAAWRPASPSL